MYIAQQNTAIEKAGKDSKANPTLALALPRIPTITTLKKRK